MRLSLLLLVFLALPGAAQNWTAVPVGTSGTLRQLEVSSSSDKHLIGDGGFVATALPPYTSWTPVPIGTTADLHGLVRQTATQIWISGSGGVVRVRDNQLNWNTRDVGTAQTLVLSSRSSGQALAYGSGGGIWFSDDLGQTWDAQTSGTASRLNAAIGGTFGTGVVVGDGGLILRTTNQGQTWTLVPSGTTADLYGIAFIASGMEAVGDGGTILRSFDDGQTWSTVGSITTETLRAVDTSGQTANRHLAVGDNGTVLTSVDNGATWCALPTGSTEDFHTGDMTTNSLFLVAGTNGTLLRTETGGGGCTPVATEPPARTEVALSAVWPNPVRTDAALTLRLDRARTLRVAVLDARGREVRLLHDGGLPAGKSVRLGIEAGGLAPGAYSVRVTGDGFVDSRPFVVVE